MTWERGRLLASYKNVDFVYDGSGERFSKTTFNGTTRYITLNGKLVWEESSENTITYLYGATGLIGCIIEGTQYYYAKNMFGDVVALIRTSDNTIVAQYVYDAWGNHKVYDSNGNENTDPYFVGNLNPIRYRSYYWDNDIGMYYLHTRWYDPEIGRFVNLDQIEYIDPQTVNGLNLYAYCGNNPVSNKQCTVIFQSNNTIISFIIPNISISAQSATYNSTQSSIINPLRFNAALADTDKLNRIPDWIYAKAIYASGSALNSLNLASIEIGVAKFGFRTPELFGSRLYLEIATLTADASIGLKNFSAHAILLSAEVGTSISDSISISGKVYVGYGYSVDFTKEGFKLGVNIGPLPFGFEITIELDWLTTLFGAWRVLKKWIN